ncbi:hypothetical protein LTR91_005883 [Friedmanniomyces endolithicus]|uniref:MIT domain-containing protein n=1 Tax=Friedmanniomyces endolithicus TaxID=329885 RepID=A0AAN6KT92_9PEZI|nr:hypothetical protein LTR75_017431 [Friedmanniomyces endolithicus]KAK0779118.1 hypothetical protein LTR59_013251 [Friedmanniomyces endolithicus]KAK0780132.1 hypothetical protein LTR38_014202 [Friedmanniomyces endolithicus]KAK0841695.1 hypothetical protein LTR03_009708 [Friedmanniomyces endolithicus]KAK0861102.1 hypothetical protein LTR87_017079 [Friedmanniomyces endolithicus]
MLAKQRYSSRSNSISSSVVTVKRTGSLSSSSTGVRQSAMPMRPQSPGEDSLTALRTSRDHMMQDHKRRKSAALEPSSHGETEGLNNLNRWSESTDSSVASLGGTRRSRASSGAALPSQANNQPSPQKRSRATVDHSPRSSPNRKPLSSGVSSRPRRSSPDASPERLRHRPSRPESYATSNTTLPPLHTTPALTDPSNDNDSPSTIQTITTPSSHSLYLVQDYFGEDGISPRNKAKDKRPVVIRNHTAPMSAINHMRTPVTEPPREPLRRTRTSEKREQDVKPLDGSGRRGSRSRESREKDKKAMLSKALQKANTAVLLDNAQNFEGALEAYADACRLLQHVMDRSSAADDKRKLEAIKVTYTNRIEELEQLDVSRPSTADAKNLPARPMSDESISFSPGAGAVSPIESGAVDSAVIETATMTRIVDVPKLSYPRRDRDSFFSKTIEAVQNSDQEGSRSRRKEASITEGSAQHEGLPLRSDGGPEVARQMLLLPALENRKYMPAPLSPRKPPSPLLKSQAEEPWQHEAEESEEETRDLEHVSGTNESAGSWLDTIDESSSCRSSVHSVSGGALRRRHIRGNSGGTDPDLHAAFDAAVEAAYDEGLEPDLDVTDKRDTAYLHATTQVITVASPDVKEVLSPTNEFHPAGSLHSLELDDDQEERLLDEITSDYAQGFNFDLSSKSALPRQSDSSTYSRSTWQSSQASGDRNTAATSLSTVAEDTLTGRLSPQLVEAQSAKFEPPPFSTALPRPPSMSGNRLSSVRSRRLSGQSGLKQLKIETYAKGDGRKRASTFHHSSSPTTQDREREEEDFNPDFKFGGPLETTTSDREHEHILMSPPSLDMRSAVQDTVRPVTATVVEERRSLDDSPSELRSAARPNFFRKNKSSLSLRDHHTLLSSPEDSATSIATPMSSTFTSFTSKRSDGPPTSQRANFQSFDSSFTASFQSGGAHLFDTSLSDAALPTSPRSPRFSTQPLGLEPCPESFLLRPFWLMRSIASTLTHPKGGFITTRVFVPREVWQTRGVKLKSLEDKVANCDLLTAALGRLAGVDTYDADAVMEELQSFEEVMERVQAALAKKLGNDVGLHGVTGLFKDAAGAGSGGTTSSNAHAAASPDAVAGAEKAATKSREGKGYLTSWRKLRNKSSGTPLTTSHPAGKTANEKDSPALSSVPMTTFMPVERRGPKRDIRNMVFEGPQKDYMGSLARLFEAAQVLDQIARQVEDPGLKHSSPTHVGLELSMRHAAEFFAFYVCRFALGDLGTLLDKFVKRGTEWVLA